MRRSLSYFHMTFKWNSSSTMLERGSNSKLQIENPGDIQQPVNEGTSSTTEQIPATKVLVIYNWTIWRWNAHRRSLPGFLLDTEMTIPTFSAYLLAMQGYLWDRKYACKVLKPVNINSNETKTDSINSLRKWCNKP